MTLGLVSNLLVIVLNHGWMPISPETILRLKPDLPESAIHLQTRLGISKDMIMPVSQTNLVWLSDLLTLPEWFPYKFAFSIGDVLLSIGAFLLLWSFSSAKEAKEVYVPE